MLNIIDGTPAPANSEKSSLAVPGGEALNLSPNAAFSTFGGGCDHIGIIHDGLGALEDLDVGRGRTRHRGSGLRRSFDPGMQFGANLGLVGADGPGELHGVGNDISSGAAMNGADASRRRIQSDPFRG